MTKIALAQTNPTVGDVRGNTEEILRKIRETASCTVRILAFPELAVCGYPPKDLLLKSGFAESCEAAIQEIDAICRSLDVIAIVGTVVRDKEGLHNSAVACGGASHADPSIPPVYHKRLLPEYDVFDEHRYFEPGKAPVILKTHGLRIGILICEDIWAKDPSIPHHYDKDPVASTSLEYPDLIVCISASPFCTGKQRIREDLVCHLAKSRNVRIAYVNQVGGNDELIFDGASFAAAPDGTVISRLGAFEENTLLVDLDAWSGDLCVYPDELESVRQALVLGIRDYVDKCGFREVTLGLSGGIDSAVTAALAVEAVGPHHVHGALMPSRYSSDHSVSDAEALAVNLDIQTCIVPIKDIHAAFEEVVSPLWEGMDADTTEENVQARIRGMILMALSNKFGRLVLTTGNKSETAVGYSTLYGDMAGGLAVISDVPKTMVFDLARHINGTAGREIIPENTITKPPSAELKDNQRDQDLLPPYDQLDKILAAYIRDGKSADEIVKTFSDRIPESVIRRTIKMIDRNEYKRQQAAPGLRVTSKAFGFGRRMPIAARFDS